MLTASLAVEFAADVRRDLALAPKQLQAKYLYDTLGSSLFEAICQLPWYRITRAECRLLQQSADEIAAALGEACEVLELGCGSGGKLAVLTTALQARGASGRVHLVDLSSAALERTAQRLLSLQRFSVVPHRADYDVGLQHAAARREVGVPVIVLLLGSNIGNFDMPAADRFLRRIRAALARGDLLLLGADLVKPEQELVLAYDDPLGLTAAFNKNLLVRVNRELGGDFDLTAFHHRAIWCAAERRIEMHLVSDTRQRVRIPAANVSVEFGRGEWIWTESSYKYTPERIQQMGAEAGFAATAAWIDQDAQFALTLFRAD